VARIDGVISADINFASGTLLVEYEPATDPREAVVRTVEGTGHGVVSLDEDAPAEAGTKRSWLDCHRSEVATAGSGGFAALGAVLQWSGAPELAATAAFAIAIAFGGLLVWRRALLSLNARVLDMNVLMTMAVFGAAAMGEWGEGATVYFLFALGGLLESRSLERTRRSIRDLMDLTPESARVVRDGRHVDVAALEVAVGETTIVRPGERIPLDGVIVAGVTAVDESPITGESIPAEKSQGDIVFAGSLNASGLIEVRVTALATESTLARIVYMVEEAQASRAPSQRLVDRFSRVYTPIVIVLAVMLAIVPPALAWMLGVDWGPWSEWVRRALVVLVVSCPCALVISTPVAIVSGITRATRDGVLVKGGAFLEVAAGIKTLALDKTGTLTRGTPEVVSVASFGGHTEAEVRSLAGALEANSNHPLARAVVRAAGESAHPGVVADFTETPGQGVSATVDGAKCLLGSAASVRGLVALDEEAEAAVGAAEDAGATALVLVLGGTAVGVIAVADEVRPESANVLERLRAAGIERTVMLTGDNQRVAAAVAQHTGVDEFRAALLPSDKTDAVRELKRTGPVAMVGDGVNDAPALAASDVGIAMGAAGSDTALETADVALMRDDLAALPGFFRLARRTMRTIIANVAFSVGVKVVFLGLAVTGNATLWMAVFADTGVSLLVILNGMRLLAPSKE